MSLFSSEKLQKKLEDVLKRHQLTPLHLMSTSGDFIVYECRGKEGKRYILKMRQRTEEELKQQFTNEILVNVFLSRFPRFPYRVVDYDFRAEPEFLLYEMMKGFPLNGYYFLIGSRNKKFYAPEKIIDLLLFLSRQGKIFENEHKEICLVKRGSQRNFLFFKKFSFQIKKRVSYAEYKMAKTFLDRYSYYLDKELVLSHGDLNPKNILVLENGQLTFLDWTDVSWNNPLFDVVSLYLTSWNAPLKRKQLLKEAFSKISSSRTLFYLNVLLLIGKFWQVLEDSQKGLEEDLKEGRLNRKDYQKMAEKIDLAYLKSKADFKEAIDFFLKKEKSTKSSFSYLDNFIELFCQEEFVLSFLERQAKKLSISPPVSNLKIKIYHKRYKELSKRLIVSYSFSDRQGEKNYTAKIRILKKEDLARKSWEMARIIWNSISSSHKFIAEPLFYFPIYKVFFYKTAPGMPFSEIIKKGSLAFQEKKEKIEKTAQYLAYLHKVDISFLHHPEMFSQEKALTYLNFLEEYLKEAREDYQIEIKEAIKKTKKELKNYSSSYLSLVHGDFQIENLVFNGQELKFIDFDDSEINDPLVDVGNFLVQIYYGGLMGEEVDELRNIFLDRYLNYNDYLDRTHLNERLNLFIIIAKIKNISQKVIRSSGIPEDVEGIKWDLFKIKQRLANLSGDPLEYFVK